jgi:hypothetical protein
MIVSPLLFIVADAGNGFNAGIRDPSAMLLSRLWAFV